MENFIVSARKYRPSTFDTVVGQPSVIHTLKNAIKNNYVAQAYLFCGPRGVGKTTCARILAKTINCYNITEAVEPCDQCESCRSFNESASFNIHELDAASNNSVDDIRSLVDQVRFAPQVGKYSIYIIDEVHMLSQAAFNAFLKTLEEPPPHAKFILATTEKHKIIPTILSRCQIFDFRRITVEDIAKHLQYIAEKENVNAEPEGLHIIAQKADGALRDALSIFDQVVSFTNGNITYKEVIDNLNVLDYEYYFSIADNFQLGQYAPALQMLDKILYLGFDGHHFVTGIGQHLRNLLVCQDASTMQLLEVSQNIKERYAEQAKRIPADLIFRALSIIARFDSQYNLAPNKRLFIEITLIQICSIVLKPQATPVIPAVQQQTQTNTQTQAQQPVQTPVQKSPAVQEKKEAYTPTVPQAPVKSQTPRLSDIGKQKTPAAENETKEEDKTPEETIRTDFSQEELNSVWVNYSVRFKDDNPSFFTFLTSSNPLLQENFMIRVSALSKIQINEFNVRKSDLIDHLRSELKNSAINIEVVLEATTQSSKPFTAKEKQIAMAEKNPAVNQLFQSLDLELDY
ncbi:MAG: DNA polymerase III subunit gamma/tau [Bacteroidota bacterium]